MFCRTEVGLGLHTGERVINKKQEKQQLRAKTNGMQRSTGRPFLPLSICSKMTIKRPFPVSLRCLAGKQTRPKRPF